MHEKKLVHIERKNLKIHVDPSLVEPHPHGNTYQSIHHVAHIFVTTTLHTIKGDTRLFTYYIDFECQKP